MKRLTLLVLPLLLAACPKEAQPPATPAPATTAAPAAAIDEQALAGYHWRLTDAADAQGQRITALFARADKPLALDFRDGHVGIGNGCNRIGGRYRVTGDTLTVDDLISTEMACEPALMALDAAISERLRGRLQARLQRDPEKLILTTSAGDVLAFDGEPTAETRYGGPGEKAFLEVAAQTKPCSHPLIPNKQCLQVREVFYDDNGLKTGTPGEFGNFYDGIEGYTHEPGVRNVLRVKRFKRDPAPADASDTVYVLDMVVESESMAR